MEKMDIKINARNDFKNIIHKGIVRFLGKFHSKMEKE